MSTITVYSPKTSFFSKPFWISGNPEVADSKYTVGKGNNSLLELPPTDVSRRVLLALTLLEGNEDVNCFGATNFVLRNEEPRIIFHDPFQGEETSAQLAAKNYPLPCKIQLHHPNTQTISHSGVFLGVDNTGVPMVFHKPGRDMDPEICALDRILRYYDSSVFRVRFSKEGEIDRTDSLVHTKQLMAS